MDRSLQKFLFAHIFCFDHLRGVFILAQWFSTFSSANPSIFWSLALKMRQTRLKTTLIFWRTKLLRIPVLFPFWSPFIWQLGKLMMAFGKGLYFNPVILNHFFCVSKGVSLAYCLLAFIRPQIRVKTTCVLNWRTTGLRIPALFSSWVPFLFKMLGNRKTYWAGFCIPCGLKVKALNLLSVLLSL